MTTYPSAPVDSGTVDEKTCTKCGETKPLDEFHRDRRNKDGKVGQCKPCACARSRAWAASNKGRKRAADKRYREAHRDDAIRRSRDWYQDNKAEALARQRIYRMQRPEQDRAAKRAYYLSHRDEILQRTREWATVNSDAAQANAWASRYRSRARRVGATVVVERFLKADVIERYGDHCAYCETGPFEQLDHYVPVSKGGPHTLENVRPSCVSCNATKAHAMPRDFLNSGSAA